MSKHSWSNSQIATVGAQTSRFPGHQVTHWMELRAVSDRVRELLKETDAKLAAIEDDRGLNPDGIKQRCAEIAKQALVDLDKLIEPAQKAADRRLQHLNAKLASVIAKPDDQSTAREIRAHIAKQASPIFAALALKGHPETVSAILGAPSYLSNISEADAATLRSQVLGSTPEQAEVNQIQAALKVVGDAVRSASSMVNARAQIPAGASLDELRAKAKAG
jgi:hypothetical protein